MSRTDLRIADSHEHAPSDIYISPGDMARGYTGYLAGLLNQLDGAAPALPELDRECGTCQGKGVVTNPEWAAWYEREKAAQAAWKATPHPGQSWYASTECDEIAQYEPEDPEISCATCNASGYVLTDTGRELIRFLQRHPPTTTRT